MRLFGVVCGGLPLCTLFVVVGSCIFCDPAPQLAASAFSRLCFVGKAVRKSGSGVRVRRS